MNSLNTHPQTHHTVKTKQKVFFLKRKKISLSLRIKQNMISLGITRMFCLLALKTRLILLLLASFVFGPWGLG